MKRSKLSIYTAHESRHRPLSAPFMTMLVIAVVGFASEALAGTQRGTVIDIIVRQTDGLTYFTVSGEAEGKPACAKHAYWMIQDEESEAGKKLYALLLAAKMSDATIIVTGTNTCTRWGDGEDVAHIRLL